MKYLLASAGVTNPSIHSALVEMLDKPIAECVALIIPTAIYAMRGGSFNAWRTVSGQEPQTPMVELGWKSVGLLELTALPSIPKNSWVPNVEEADVLLVGGGDALYLAYWMRQSGLAEMVPSLKAVWLGMSAGSMVLTPGIGEFFADWKPPTGDDSALGMVDFSIFPHLNHPMLPYNTTANAEKWAAVIPNPSYAIDDQTAIRVVDGKVDVISEGNWTHFPRG